MSGNKLHFEEYNKRIAKLRPDQPQEHGPACHNWNWRMASNPKTTTDWRKVTCETCMRTDAYRAAYIQEVLDAGVKRLDEGCEHVAIENSPEDGFRCSDCGEPVVLRTKKGKIITPDDIDRWVSTAEIEK